MLLEPFILDYLKFKYPATHRYMNLKDSPVGQGVKINFGAVLISNDIANIYCIKNDEWLNQLVEKYINENKSPK